MAHRLCVIKLAVASFIKYSSSLQAIVTCAVEPFIVTTGYSVLELVAVVTRVPSRYTLIVDPTRLMTTGIPAVNPLTLLLVPVFSTHVLSVLESIH